MSYMPSGSVDDSIEVHMSNAYEVQVVETKSHILDGTSGSTAMTSGSGDGTIVSVVPIQTTTTVLTVPSSSPQTSVIRTRGRSESERERDNNNIQQRASGAAGSSSSNNTSDRRQDSNNDSIGPEGNRTPNSYKYPLLKKFYEFGPWIGRNRKAICLGCRLQTSSSQPDRLLKHLNKCNALTAEDKVGVQDLMNERTANKRKKPMTPKLNTSTRSSSHNNNTHNNNNREHDNDSEYYGDDQNTGDELTVSANVKLENGTRKAPDTREQLKNTAKRIVVKVGSAIITHEKGHLSAPRLASIVEQIAHLQQQGRQMLLVSSGAVAFGRKKIRDEVQKSLSNRHSLSENQRSRPLAENRAAAAVGQSSLMSFYESLFQQYDCKVAQVLVTKADFHNEASRRQLRNTILDLLILNIVPIVNTNDAVENFVTRNLNGGVLDLKQADMTDIIVEDNDSLAAILAVELESDLMIMLSNVDGIYSGPPDKKGSRFYPTFTPQQNSDRSIEYGSKSNVGLGGMQAKVKSALWALKKGTSVVICNGSTSGVISQVVQGDRVGTFFTDHNSGTESSQLAMMARDGSKALKSAGSGTRSQIILDIAQSLIDNQDTILAENERDLEKARSDNIEDVLLARLRLTKEKLSSLVQGLRQIAEQSKTQVDRTLKFMKISETMKLRQITCPIGVLLVIFESRPDCLPQISALSLATANGLLLKGGKEAALSNRCLYNLIKDVLKKYNCHDAIQLVDSRERVNELASLGEHIDLIIPRGSNQLVRSIQQQAKSTPVLGHAEGICHVYIDKDVDEDEAVRIAVDSKCNYPAACNAMETLLIHKSIVGNDLFSRICNSLKERGVKLNIGSRLSKVLPFYNSASTNYSIEYGTLECLLETVDSVEEAIDHINRYGSRHTDAIVTTSETAAREFKRLVESASVFVNCSTRFADGYRYGLGAEVGISTSKIHARGPAGMESLLTYKWVLEGLGDVVEDYEQGGDRKYIHQEMDVSSAQ